MSYIDTLFNLSGRTAIVTGSSKGIGLACANMLAQSGCRVFGLARSEPQSDVCFDHRICDIRNQQNLTQMIHEILGLSPKTDILVNAAGITNPAPGKDCSDDQLDTFLQTLELNLTASYRLINLLVPNMKDNRSGSIINITSIGAEFGFPGNPGYVASKGGLKMLSKAMANDLGAFGIRVNNIAPGYIKTDMTQKSFNDPKLHQQRLRNMILPRWGTVDDIAKAAVFLASDASSYITGSDLFVDGGWSAKGMV